MERDAGRIFRLIERGYDPYQAMASERFGKRNPKDVTEHERLVMKLRFMEAVAGEGVLPLEHKTLTEMAAEVA